jgi:hypothetical protein
MGFVAMSRGSTVLRVESSLGWATKWGTREEAVAYALRWIDAKIVDSMAELSAAEPTIFIEAVAP